MGRHPTHGSMHSYVEIQHATRSLQLHLVSSWHSPLLWCYTWHPCQVWQHAIQWLILLAATSLSIYQGFYLSSISISCYIPLYCCNCWEKPQTIRAEENWASPETPGKYFLWGIQWWGGITWHWIWNHRQLYVPHGCLVIAILIPDSVPVPSMKNFPQENFLKLPNDIQTKRKLP